MTTTKELDIGTGIYSVYDASRIVGRSVGRSTPRQIRYWVREGFSESLSVEGNILLSFQDLVSLEMVSRFRERGISLQAIRFADRRLRMRHPDLRHPFASSVFYTDGQRVWTLVGDETDPDMVEIIGRVDQFVWKQVIETFAVEITLVDGQATCWRPNNWVEINPHIQFGEPVVAGTRVTVRTVASNLEVGTAAEVAQWYGLSLEQVEGARSYLDVAA
jgi:uncharacterized protein (DUF433 family)/DNA-binding transcriptional MerR regulator